jgi:peptide-methionine (S)-S-oxide reductase
MKVLLVLSVLASGLASAQNEASAQPVQQQPAVAYAMFGAGCFWGVEETFRQIPGVVATAAGYSGGVVQSPTYEQVHTGQTGHAEVVLVQYDPAKVTYEQLLQVFWLNHDPTSFNQQGPDVGEQYRSVVFYYSPEQKAAAEASRAEVQKLYPRPIVTQILPAGTFWFAEKYHQQYLEKRGLTACH